MSIKKAFWVAPLLAAGLLLTGCASTSTPTPASSPSESVWSDTPVEVTPEDSYLYALHSVGNVYIEGNTDSDLVNLGYQVCSALDTGATVYDLVVSLVSTGDYTDQASQEFAGSIIGAAVANFCPVYSSQLE